MKRLWVFQGYLTEDALTAVKTLLPESAGGDFAAICSWPDEIRHNFHWRWSSALHYVDTPDFSCNYKYCRKYFFINSHSSFFPSFAFHGLYRLLISLHWEYCILTIWMTDVSHCFNVMSSICILISFDT